MTKQPSSQLDERSNRLCEQFDPENFVRDTALVTEQLRSWLGNAMSGSGTVLPSVSPDELLKQWPDPEDELPTDLSRLCEGIIEGSTSQHHPGFVGQQLSAPPPLVGPVAMVASILNNSAAIYEGAPVGIALEHRIVSWMVRKAGYGDEASGVLTSGGTLGALTAMLAMRQAMIGNDSWSAGLAGLGKRYAVFVSQESHYCNTRACAAMGLGEQAAIPVATDASFRIDVDRLSALYEKTRTEGFHPVALIANACSTATGSYDNLPALADFCRDQGLWFHVDAAHGGSALLSARYRTKLQGIERADSIVWDAHKMLQMPGLCTAVLFRNAIHLDHTFRQEAAYLKSDAEEPWCQPALRNFETTKPTMALPLYAALRILGTEYFAECVDYAWDLARCFADEIESHAEFELLVPPESNIVCFRRRSNEGDSDALQLALRDRTNFEGRFFIMRTTLRGKIWLRVVLMNPATRMEHLRELLDELSVPCQTLNPNAADQIA